MFNDTIEISKYNSELVPFLAKDFIDTEDVDDMIEHLNQVEQKYVDDYKDNPAGYIIDLREASTHLLMINDLVNNKKVIPDSDMFGLLIMANPKKRTGNSNQTPKKKKRK